MTIFWITVMVLVFIGWAIVMERENRTGFTYKSLIATLILATSVLIAMGIGITNKKRISTENHNCVICEHEREH